MIIIRPAIPDDALAIAHVHRQAVQELAKDHYTLEEREDWSPPVDQSRIDKVLNEMKKAIMVVADNDGVIAGFGSIIPSENELHACYVLPSFARQGVGSKIMDNLEKIAKEHDLKILKLNSSLCAEAFYKSKGFSVEQYRKYTTNCGGRINSASMIKNLP